MRANRTSRLLAMLLAAVMLFSLLPVVSFAAGAETLAELNFTEATALPAAASSGYGYLNVNTGANLTYSSGALSSTKWAEGKYWAMVFNTSGCTDLTLSFKVYSSGTGPKNFAAEYSTDNGESWTGFGSYTASASLKAQNLTLPNEAQSTNLIVRLRVTDSENVNGATIGSSGTSKINNIKLTGTVGDGHLPNPEKPTWPAELDDGTGSGSGGGSTGGTTDNDAIAAFKFDSVVGLPTTATTGYGFLAASPEGTVAYSTSALSMNKWKVDDCWLMIFNTTGCTEMNLAADVMSSGTGPANFAAEYSVDNGENWAEFGTYTIANTGKLQNKSFALPDAAQSANLMIRLRVTDNAACKGEDATIGSTGTSKINNIKLTGKIGEGRLDNPEEPTWPEGWGDTEVEDPGEGAPLPGFNNATVVGDPVVQWQFNGATSLPAQASYGWGTTTHWNAAYISFVSSMLSQTGWAQGGYWQFVANTTGVTQMTFQMRTMSSSTGPRDLSLRYSTDLGATWVEFAKLSVTASAKNYVAQLPDEAQSDNLIVRIVVCSDYSVKGDVIKNGGSNKINNIAIYGIIDSAAHLPNPAEPAYPADFTPPAPYNPDDVYTPEPDESANVSDAVTDESDRRVIAQWGGNANYEGAMFVYGDLISANDRLDGSAVFTTCVGGKIVSPGFSTSSTNSTNYFLGSKGPCVGSGTYVVGQDEEGNDIIAFTDDYMQMKVSTAKYADLSLSFRLRVSGTGPSGFTAKYSTDGENWTAFENGSYTYTYTGYGYGGSTYEVTGEGTIENGYIPMEVDSQYEDILLDVPTGAENAKTLYIRLFADHTRADGKEGGIGSSASVRIDTIELSGCPMHSKSIVEYVLVDVTNSVPAGQVLTFTTATPDATIYYSYDSGKTVQTYDPNNKPVLEKFPTLVTVWAEKNGMYPSIKSNYYYTQAQVGPVKASPNGGAVVADTTVHLSCATEGAEIRYSFNNGESWQTYDHENKPVLTEEMLQNECTMLVMAVKEGYLNSPVSSLTFSLRVNAFYNLYFGQLHSHTNYSDGAGSCEEAFIHASTEVANLDFLAVTDHSNAFDNDAAASIYDGSMSNKWVSGHELADKYTGENFVGIYGYEMTWSNGLGHMNTYNTAGFQSRTQSEFSSYATALSNYYNALRSDTNSISQFNHPGTTFGTFQDYAYYDEDIDELITIIEVGNGEGTIGSSGYFPSYEEYTRALDLGWHVAPTNNQDNHKGNWGDSNTARSVVMADSLTRNNILDAIRNRRVYATEDNDLSIYYTLNGYEMGTILTEDDIDGTVLLKAKISDPTDSGNCKVEVIVNGGLIAATKSVSVTDSTVEFELPADYSYYYLRITQADKNIAVTAPVWIGKVEAIGIKEFSADTALPIQNEPTQINFTMYNDEATDLTIESIEFSVNDEVVHTVDLTEAGLDVLKAGTVGQYSFEFTYSGIGTTILEATVKGKFNGVEKQYNGVLQMKYLPASIVSNVIIDGTHFNDYVTGSYAGNTTMLANLGTDLNAKVTVVYDEITAEMLEDCQLLVISAPAKRTLDGYRTSHFEDEFIALVAQYMANGGSVVLCGSADYNDSTAGQTHTEMNKLLAGIGATVRLRSDEVVEKNDKDELIYGLELGTFDADSEWLSGASEGMTFSIYSACSIDMSASKENDKVYAAKALVSGNTNTFSIDTKTNTGYAGSNSVMVPEGEVVMAAVQDTKADGHIFLSGSVFYSDYNMETDEHAYKLNAVLMSNILKKTGKTMEVTPIAEMRKGELGDVFCIEGWVTNGTDNDKTKFFDTIYIQDETGGVTVYPFAENGLKRGTKMRIVGYVDEYQDDREIQILSYEILDDQNLNIIDPEVLSCKDAMDYETNGGKLVKTQGVIVSISYQGDAVTQLRLKDAAGDIATIFIDGYIYSGTTGLNELNKFCVYGIEVSAVGMCFMHPETGSDVSSCCLRVRDCDEIVYISDEHVGDPNYDPVDDPNDDPKYENPFVDVLKGTFYYDAVLWAVNHDPQITTGMTPTYFRPEGTCVRAQVVTFLWRAVGCPEPESTSCPFTDVSEDRFYYKAVLWAVENGITTGTSATKFSPDSPCTRAQVVTFLWRTMNTPDPEKKDCPFTDVNSTRYYYNAVLWAVENGITTGTSAERFSPESTCTRGQIVTFLYRALAES